MGVYLGSNAVDMQGGFVTGGASGASLQSKTVSPSESAQTVKADNGYDGLSQVTVNAVSRTYVGSGVTKKSAATYTPGTSDQSIASGQYLFLSTLSLRRATAKVHKTVGHFCAYETTFMGIASSC